VKKRRLINFKSSREGKRNYEYNERKEMQHMRTGGRCSESPPNGHKPSPITGRKQLQVISELNPG